MSVHLVSLPHTISRWMNVRSQESPFELCKLSTTAYIIHEIWVARCRARFERTANLFACNLQSLTFFSDGETLSELYCHAITSPRYYGYQEIEHP